MSPLGHVARPSRAILGLYRLTLLKAAAQDLMELEALKACYTSSSLAMDPSRRASTSFFVLEEPSGSQGLPAA